MPHRVIRAALIEPQWNEVLRFIATIRLKVATASQLFKRLNSYSKQHPLYQALKEFGKMPKSLFILKYVDGKNAIICWNYLFLTRALDQEPDPAHKAELVEAMRNGSMATWRHFNLHGEFDFSDDKMVDSVGLVGPKNPQPWES